MNWDQYFLNICKTVASNSKCLSRKLGAIIVRDRSIISCGYNGAARGLPHCGERYTVDERLVDNLPPILPPNYTNTCPRRVLGLQSGEGLEWCYAQHAEASSITNAARIGVPTVGATLYLNWIIPCADCLSHIINAGIVEVVVTELKIYNNRVDFILKNSKLKIREYIL